jgi:MFS family permease
MESSLSLMLQIVGIVLGLLSNGGSMYLLTRIRRRKLLLWTITASAALYTGMGIAGIWDGVVTVWWTGITLMVVITTCSLGAWPACYAVMGETSSLRLRAKTQAIGGVGQQIVSVVFKFCLPYVFNPDAGNLRAKTGFVYTGFCLIGFAVTWAIVPEMKDRNALEIDRMFDLGLKAREFRKWSGDNLPLHKTELA